MFTVSCFGETIRDPVKRWAEDYPSILEVFGVMDHGVLATNPQRSNLKLWWASLLLQDLFNQLLT
jgi:hypothetical protein